MNEYIGVLKNYWLFTGRATRREYWMFVLANSLISIGLGLVAGATRSSNVIGTLYGLAVVIPGVGVTVRRFHDIGKSGSWIFINLIPLVGAIIAIVLLAKEGQAGENQYGPDPKVVIVPETPSSQ